METSITVSHLKKNFGQVDAVKDVSFSVEKGKLFSFLGPNGAGKSSTINVLCTLLPFDGGAVEINGFQLGKDDAAIRREIGVVFQENMLDDLLTVEENLKIRAGFYFKRKEERMEAMKRAARTVEITDVLHRPYGKLSGGQRRRADIARALLHAPRILFLDEPTTGLDPNTRRSVWNTVRLLQKEQNMTVFLTTHYMEEAAASDQVVVIDGGTVSAQGTPTQLKECYAKDLLKLSVTSLPAARQAFTDAGVVWREEGGRLVVPLHCTMDALPLLSLVDKYLTAFEVLQGTMDDAFLAITGKGMQI